MYSENIVCYCQIFITISKGYTNVLEQLFIYLWSCFYQCKILLHSPLKLPRDTLGHRVPPFNNRCLKTKTNLILD